MKAKPHHVILGAGISGLALGWYLKKRHHDSITLTILEKESRVGGWIRTCKEGGFLFEQGPRSCRTRGTGWATLELIEDLSLQDQVITASLDARKRYIYYKGSLHQIPTNPVSFVFSPLTQGILPALWKEWRAPKGRKEDESIYDFFSRRLSPELAERWIDPFVLGIYAGDIRKLSLKSCFPILHRWEEEQGSILKGWIKGKRKQQMIASEFVKKIRNEPMFSLKNGLEALPKELYRRLKEQIFLNSPVEKVLPNSRNVEVYLKEKEKIIADHLYVTLPSFEASRIGLIPETHFMDFASVYVLNLGWKKKVLLKEGFGYLIPSKEQEHVLGVVWDSCVFPQQSEHQEETRMTVMVKDHIPEDKVLATGREVLHRHLGISCLPDTHAIFKARNAIPQYEVGYSEKRERLPTDPRVTFLGSSFHGVSVNDCIHSARSICGA